MRLFSWPMMYIMCSIISSKYWLWRQWLVDLHFRRLLLLFLFFFVIFASHVALKFWLLFDMSHHLLSIYLLGPLAVFIALLITAILWFLANRKPKPISLLQIDSSVQPNRNGNRQQLREKNFLFDIEFRDLGLTLKKYDNVILIFILMFKFEYFLFMSAKKKEGD